MIQIKDSDFNRFNIACQINSKKGINHNTTASVALELNTEKLAFTGSIIKFSGVLVKCQGLWFNFGDSGKLA